MMKKLIQQLRSGLKLVAFITILVVVTLAAGRLDVRWDMTTRGIYSLSDQSVRALDSLEESVQIYFFHTDEGRSTGDPGRVRWLARRYAEFSSRVQFQEVDPVRRTNLTEEFDVQANNSLVVEVGGRHKKLTTRDLYSISRRRRGTGKFKGEVALTRALVKLTRATDRAVYFARGAGEYSLRGRKRSVSGLASALEQEGYSVEAHNIYSSSLPETGSLLVVMGPRKEYGPEVLDRLREWNRNGGHLFVAPGPGAATGFNPLLESTGLRFSDYHVIDSSRRASLTNPFVFVPVYSRHPAVDPLRKGNLKITAGRSPWLKNSGDTAEPLLRTSGEAFAKPIPDREKKVGVEYDPATDERGPFTVGASVSGRGSTGRRGKLVVLAGASQFSNARLGSAANKNFALNLVNWIFDRSVSVGIRPTPLQYNTVQVTASQAYFLQLLALVLVPGLVVIWGGLVWWNRKNR